MTDYEATTSKMKGGLHGYEDSEFDKNRSPFKPPNDEEVFVTRETEKQKKKEAKEMAKNLKIWDKNTATSRAPLRRVLDSDIDPAENEDNLYNFNTTQRGYISAAMHIARSRVQFPREQRPQNIQEFIDQKKEMFLVELAQNTIDTEIKDLITKSNNRDTALKESLAELDKDQTDLLKFIEEDNRMKKDKDAEEKKQIKEKQDKEEKIKNLDVEIANIKSDIDKNKVSLESANNYKEFLLKLSEKQFVDQQENKKNEKREKIMRDWIRRAKEDEKFNELIFGDDEDIFGEQKYVPEFMKDQQLLPQNTQATNNQIQSTNKKEDLQAQKVQTLSGAFRNKKANLNLNERKRQIKDYEWDIIFDQLMKGDLIEISDSSYYHEELQFKDKNELNEIFATLETKNLFYINQAQDIEQQLDTTRQQKLEIEYIRKKEHDREDKNKRELEKKIANAQSLLEDLQNKSKLMTMTNDSSTDKKKKGQEQELNIEGMIEQLRKEIILVYQDSKESKDVRDKDQVRQKAVDLQTKGSLDMLMEIELTCDSQMRKIKFYESDEVTKVMVQQLEKQAKLARTKEKREQITEDNLRKEREKKEAAALRNQTEFKAFGKKQMWRSNKRMVQKKEVKIERDQDQEDRLKYLGDIGETE